MFSQKSKNILEIENPIRADDFSENDTSDRETTRKEKKGQTIFFWLITLILVALLGRAFYLQVIKNDYFRDIAENNRIRSAVIRAPRGLIKDRHGELLASNLPSYDIVVVPAYLPKEKVPREKVFQNLKKIASFDEKIYQIIAKEETLSDQRAFLISEDIEEERALKIIEMSDKLPGIHISNKAKRDYPEGKAFAHIIGYDGIVNEEELKEHPQYSMIDYIGKQGLEKAYEKYLHGQNGLHRYEINSDNRVIKNLGTLPAQAGWELILGVDSQLQKKAEEVLNKILEENPDATGVALAAIDPRDGKVRALISLPTFDNNDFSGGISQPIYQSLISDENNPLLNRVTSGEYPPGSTIKPVIASAALEEGLVHEHTTIDCPGHISIGQWNFPDWKTHGVTDIKKAIAESCDVFFYAIGGGWGSIGGLGIDRMNQYGRMFGMGDKTGIDLPTEQDGLMPNDTWKFKKLGEKWYIGDSYHAAIGQGYISATPLQMATAAATLANGGTLYAPTLVEKMINPVTREEKIIKSKERGQILVSTKNVRVVREGMKQTVYGEKGSGRRLASLEVQSAGKTGTAQFGGQDKTHAWYISFAPYDNPELAMVVLIEGGGDGDKWAVPATKDIFEWYFDHKRGTEVPESNDELEVMNDE